MKKFLNTNGTIRNQDKYQRNFGYIMSAIFFLVAIYPLLFNSSLRIWSLIISVALLLCSFLYRKILKFPSIIWFKFGILLHILFSPIILFVVYILSIVVTGFILKIFKKDPLNKKFNKNLKSYWINKEKKDINIEEQH